MLRKYENQSSEGQGKMSRRESTHHSVKRKSTEGNRIEYKESAPKKVKFGTIETMAPVPKENSELKSVDATSQKKDKRKKKRFMKTDLKTIKKSRKPSIFDRVKLTTAGKPNWKDIKKESLILKKERKETKQTHYNVVLQIKNIWESVRYEKCPEDKRAKDIVKLHSLVQNQLSKLVYAHDTSRIVQGLIRLVSPSIRASISDELAPIFLEMMQRKFSAFCVKSIIKYGDQKSKAKVLESTKGNILKLLTNIASAPLLEKIYSQHASSEQKTSMEQEFLGSFLLTLNMSTIGSIGKILKELKVENKPSVLETTKENIIKVISKGNITSSLLRNVALQFLEVCSPEDRQEILALLSPHILDLMGTKTGSRLGVQCIWFLNKKVRKTIVKQVKGHVPQISMSEHSFWIILALLDSVDDTVLLNKTIVSEIANSAATLVQTEYGRKVLLYLVAHRDTAYFHPEDLKYLEQGDTSAFCLKSISTKRKELSPVIDTLLQKITEEFNTWMKDAKVAMVTLATLKNGTGEKLHDALCALAKYICSDVVIDNQPLIENSGMNLILKKLLKFDETRADDTDKFSVQLASVLEEQTIKKWITCNRGSFLLVGILETKSEKAIKMLVSKISTDLREQISKESKTGTKVLHKVLNKSAPP